MDYISVCSAHIGLDQIAASLPLLVQTATLGNFILTRRAAFFFYLKNLRIHFLFIFTKKKKRRKQTQMSTFCTLALTLLLLHHTTRFIFPSRDASTFYFPPPGMTARRDTGAWGRDPISSESQTFQPFISGSLTPPHAGARGCSQLGASPGRARLDAGGRLVTPQVRTTLIYLYYFSLLVGKCDYLPCHCCTSFCPASGIASSQLPQEPPTPPSQPRNLCSPLPADLPVS